MNYQSVSDLNQTIINWIPRLPKNIDLIVGIPRSGLLAANLLALHLNKPLTDVDGLIAGRLLSSGYRVQEAISNNWLAEQRRVLILDDSICSGKQMNEVKRNIASEKIIHSLTYAAVYATSESKRSVDYFAKIIKMPRIFEWNIMHHAMLLRDSCMDIDGVLCEDPEDAENDDGVKYEAFITNAASVIIPTHAVGWLVTCRLEKYRVLTEQWLYRHGVRYGHLEMLNLPNKEARISAGCHASFKARVYSSTGAVLFIESSCAQAREIVKITGKPVFCYETRQMVLPGVMAKTIQEGSNFLKRLWWRHPIPRSIRRIKAGLKYISQ